MRSNQRWAAIGERPWHLRIGLHSGNVMSCAEGMMRTDCFQVAQRIATKSETGAQNWLQSFG